LNSVTRVNGRRYLIKLYRILPVLTSLGVGSLILVNSYYGMLHGNPLFTFLYRTFLGNILLLLYTTTAAYVIGSITLESLVKCTQLKGRGLFKDLVDALLVLALVPVSYSIVSLKGLPIEVEIAVSLAYSYLVVLALKGLRGRLVPSLLLTGLVHSPLILLAVFHPEAIEGNLKKVADLLTSLEEVIRILGLT